MNQDLQPVQAAVNTSSSPDLHKNNNSKYQILGTQSKSKTVLKPFLAGSSAVAAAAAMNFNSQKSLSRVTSNKFSLRQQSVTDVRIKNMYVHRAGGSRRVGMTRATPTT